MTKFTAKDRIDRLEDEGIDIATIGDKEFVTHSAGGCWICNKESPNMQFDMEFDCFYHQGCLDTLGVDSILEYERKY